MSQPQGFKSFRELFRYVRNYGQEDLARMKAEALQLKQQLDAYLEEREARKAADERHMLQQLRDSVGLVSGQVAAVKAQRAQVEADAAELDVLTERVMRERAHELAAEKFERLARSVDLRKFMGGASLEESLKAGADAPQSVLRAVQAERAAAQKGEG